jgi:hypothetical protein
VLTVDIALTRGPDGRYLARVSFDDQAGWETCRARSARLAFDRAAALAVQRLNGARVPPSPGLTVDHGPAPRPTQIWSRKPAGRGRPGASA